MTNDTRIIKAAADFLSTIARVARMSKENCQVADNHAQELYSLLVRPEPKQEGRIAELGLSGGDIVERVTEHDKWSVKDIGCTYRFVSHSMYCHTEHLIKLPIGSGWTSSGDKGTFRVVSRAGSSQ